MIKLALRNLTRRRTRTILTILGVAIAITFTVGLLSITEGFISSFEQSTEERGEDIFVLPEEVAGHPMPMMESYGARFPEEYVGDIQSIDNVKAVYPVYTQTLYFGTGGKPMEDYIGLNGVTPAFLTELRPFLEVEHGRLLEEGDEYKLVVGSAVAEAQGLEVGSTLPPELTKGQGFEVVGILKSSGGFDDFLAYAPIETLQGLYGDQDKLTIAAVTVKDLDKTEETAREITEALPNVAARTMEELVSMMSDFLSMARAMHFSIASIALLIGVLFILSTMLMTVSERMKEIGTMRAIGVSRRTLFRLIVTESLITGLIAGALGCLGGFGLSKLISYAIAEFAGVAFLQTMVSPRIFAAGLLIALLIGALAGLYPAWRISKVNIVEALRYE